MNEDTEIHYQLRFDMPQAGCSCIKCDITKVGKSYIC